MNGPELSHQEAHRAWPSHAGVAGSGPVSSRSEFVTERRGREASRTPVPAFEASNGFCSAAGRPRPSVEQLLLEQNRLLTEQLSYLREQVQHQHSNGQGAVHVCCMEWILL